ncbi:MAG: bifunctional DNA-formamidopyrimidine glycosylase/DNA-(apurinic or apyrimidinic site) lyase [Gammaproteobacteria bacterium]|nr:bifunctional DNA-formamidopyrimidine glycosylase/DNA-(apurinic or apyrimidinic site) lyase [Gammaproteobacteria bacterium]
MPELPEVETTRRGIAPHIEGQTVQRVILRRDTLRWPIPDNLDRLLRNQPLQQVTRRAKYLQLQFAHGMLLIHLGMSGGLRILHSPIPAPGKHDHVDIIFSNGTVLRFHDPRRFGCVLWSDDGNHSLLTELGPEPLDDTFDAQYLFDLSRKKTVNIKGFIMNSRNVVGVGNIYASEALFMAGILPTTAAGDVSRARFEKLCQSIKLVLTRAIDQGGTTLKDFSNSDGKPGYFAQQLQVYGREGLPCPKCANAISKSILAQRATYYCGRCQR